MYYEIQVSILIHMLICDIDDFRSLTVGQTALSVHLAVGPNNLNESAQILLEASG